MKKTTTYPRSPRTRCAHGSGAPERVPLGVGGHRGHSSEDWLRRANPAWLDSSASDRHRAAARSKTSDEREHIKALERENRELRKANEILRLASAHFAQEELDRRTKS